MIKKYKIFSFNIFLLIIFLLCIEICSILWYKYKYNFDIQKHIINCNFYKSFISYHLQDDIFNYRTVEYKNSLKKPIVIFGCSFAHGDTLKNNECFSHKLANYTNRTVYNRALSGAGTSSMLYQLQKDDFKKIVPDAEYFIYVFIIEHIRRNYSSTPFILWPVAIFPQYYIKDNKLKRYEFNYLSKIIHSFFSYRIYDNKKSFTLFYKKDFLLFNKILLESKKIIQEKYPQAKLIILVYDDNTSYFGKYSIEEIEKYINNSSKETGIPVLYTKHFDIGSEMIKNKFISTDKIHPSGEVWDYIVPELSQKLNL